MLCTLFQKGNEISIDIKAEVQKILPNFMFRGHFWPRFGSRKVNVRMCSKIFALVCLKEEENQLFSKLRVNKMNENKQIPLYFNHKKEKKSTSFVLWWKQGVVEMNIFCLSAYMKILALQIICLAAMHKILPLCPPDMKTINPFSHEFRFS